MNISTLNEAQTQRRLVRSARDQATAEVTGQVARRPRSQEAELAPSVTPPVTPPVNREVAGEVITQPESRRESLMFAPPVLSTPSILSLQPTTQR